MPTDEGVVSVERVANNEAVASVVGFASDKGWPPLRWWPLLWGLVARGILDHMRVFYVSLYLCPNLYRLRNDGNVIVCNA